MTELEQAQLLAAASSAVTALERAGEADFITALTTATRQVQLVRAEIRRLQAPAVTPRTGPENSFISTGNAIGERYDAARTRSPSTSSTSSATSTRTSTSSRPRTSTSASTVSTAAATETATPSAAEEWETKLAPSALWLGLNPPGSPIYRKPIVWIAVAAAAGLGYYLYARSK